jgi:hemerythrin-like domain-containing protein
MQAPSVATGIHADPLEQLEAGHWVIEAHIDALEDLIAHLAKYGCDERARETAGVLTRHFDSFATHVRDEEEGLFPMVRAHAKQQGRQDLIMAIRQAELDHAVMCDIYAVLRRQLVAMALRSSRRLDSKWAERFAWLCRRHITNEAGLIMPYAAQALEAAQREALEALMRARRA